MHSTTDYNDIMTNFNRNFYFNNDIKDNKSCLNIHHCYTHISLFCGYTIKYAAHLINDIIETAIRHIIVSKYLRDKKKL